VEEGEIVGVVRHVPGVGARGDDTGVRVRRQAQEHIRQDDGHGTGELMKGAEPRPSARQEHELTPRQEQNEEDEHRGVPPVHGVGAEAAQARRETTSRESVVQRQNAARYVDPYCAVEPCYGRVSADRNVNRRLSVVAVTRGLRWSSLISGI
jgi:hypothetical protein